MQLRLELSLFVFHVIRCAVVSSAQQNITIASLLYQKHQDKYGYWRSIQLARQLIENSTDFQQLTDNYAINLEIADLTNKPSSAIYLASELARKSPKPIAMLGPSLPQLTKPTAQALDQHKILLVPFSPTTFVDKSKKYVVSSSPAANAVMDATIAFMKHFSWKGVGILYDFRRADGFFTVFTDDLVERLKTHGIAVNRAAGIDTSSLDIVRSTQMVREQLLSLKSTDTKIFLAEVDSFGALVLFCEIYKLRLYGPDIVWLLNPMAGSLDAWLYWYNSTEHGNIVSCSREEIKMAADGAFLFERLAARRDNKRTASGLTTAEYTGRLVQMASPGQAVNEEDVLLSAYSFDAFWAVSKALNNALKKNISLDTVTANMSSLTNSIIGELNMVSFEGLTGPFSYSSYQRNGVIVVKQFKGTKMFDVAQHFTQQGKLEFFNDTSFLWKNGMVPLHSTKKITLTIACFVYQQSDDKFGYVRSVQLAKQLIENRTDFKLLTDNYDIRLRIVNPHSNPSYAIYYANQLVRELPKPIVFLGPAIARLTEPTAQALEAYRTLMVPFTYRMYVDINKKYVMSTSPDMPAIIQAKVAFMKRFSWSRAAVLYNFRSNGGYFTSFVDVLTLALHNNSIKITGTYGIDPTKHAEESSNFIQTKLQALKNDDTKIYLVEVDPYGALVLFCEIYKLNLFGPDVVWLLHPMARNIEAWLLFNNSKSGRIVSCSKEQIQLAATGAFIFERILLRNDNVRTSSGLTADEYVDKLVAMATGRQSRSRHLLMSSGYSFDAFWAVSVALNNTLVLLMKHNVTLDTKNGLGRLTPSIRHELHKVSFEGMTGPLSFDASERQGVIVIKQFKDKGRLDMVGQHLTTAGTLFFYNGTDNLWPNGEIPKDRSTTIVKTLRIQQPILIALSTASAVAILLGILFLTFNLVYRKYKFIKLSAPLFNNIIACGCILCLISVYLFGVNDAAPSTFSIICKARAWTLSIGFSCAFGAMFIKTWRIYKICTNKKLKVKLGPLSNWYLLSLVGGIIFVDLVLLITWEIVDPLHHAIYKFTKVKDTTRPFTYISKQLNVCSAKDMILWLTVLYVYKGILLLYGLFLAYETRNVIYAHLNDSRVIGICVYNVVVLSVVGALLSILMQPDNYEVMYVVLSVCIIFPATATICLLLFPKVSYRCKTNNLDDAETTINGNSARSMDFTSTCYPAEPSHREKSPPIQHGPNVVFSYQNGAPASPTGSPAKEAKPENSRTENSRKESQRKTVELPGNVAENHLTVEKERVPTRCKHSTARI